jgi:CheY-like chemotaxis protein
LRGFDLRIDVVGDGVEAVRAARSFAYDAIFMDVRMPEMDGLDATREIRALGGQLATVPIIALTANAFPEDVAACFTSGMSGFVAKPFRGETLLAALLNAMERPAQYHASGAAVLDNAEAGP